MQDVLIIGGGVGGLTLALCLHRNGIPCTVLEAAPEVKPLGVGVNILPHGAAELARLGLEDALLRHCVQTDEANFFNRFGQLIHREKLGRAAGYDHPQMSIHRADLHGTLLDQARARLGPDRVLLDRRCAAVEQDAAGVTVRFEGGAPALRGAVAIGADGVHSAVRRQLHPREGEPRYTGYNMWRGVTPWPRILTGASMTRVGWLTTGKMVIYPIRDAVNGPDGKAGGDQLINWVFEVETATHRPRRDWTLPGRAEDVLAYVKEWQFDWLDVPAMVAATPAVLEYPMVDQDPLPWWTQGRVTLLGDAAHPMVPRGSNGAGQAILDARCLADLLAARPEDPAAALAAYEAERRPATTQVVLTNRANPPDAILREVFLRTGDRPFDRIEDVMSRDEMLAITGAYKRVAGYDLERLAGRG